MYIPSGEWVIIFRINSNSIIRYLKSLRLRLFLILLLVGIVPLQILRFGFLRNYQDQSVRQMIGLISSRSKMIAEDLAEERYLYGYRKDTIDTQLTQLGSLWGGRVVVVGDNFRITKDTAGEDEGKFLLAKEVQDCFNGGDGSRYISGKQELEVTVPIMSAETDVIEGLMIISVPTNDIETGKARLSHRVWIIQGVVILLVLLASFYASRMLVKPFGKVTASFEDKDAFLEEEISMPGYTETEALASAYNAMRSRLKAQEESRQEFVSNVSHELKTPLTSMKVLADSLVAQGDAPVEMYREFMTDIAHEIDRENTIITDLLNLVKLDRKSGDLNVQETNINDLIELILKRLRPIAATADVELVLEDYKPIIAQVDQTKLTLAISNLIENGIKYNLPGGWVHVSLNMDNNFFFVKVEDSGLGIPEEDQEKIFDRFYRVDKSHSREIGGTGLGLAITKNAVLMHNGAIKVYSRLGEGTTFTVRIPLRYGGASGEKE